MPGNGNSKPKNYLEKLRDRAKQSKVYRKFQLEGLEIAKILGDEKHKALYIKLAKEHDTHFLRRLAEDVAERGETVRNKGAYFMSRLKALGTKKLKQNDG